MRKKTVCRIHDLIGLVHALYPPALAEEWDNVGLQVGDPGAEVSRVMIALDPSAAAVETAAAAGAQLLLTHHPLIFRPLQQIVPQDEIGRTVMAAVRGNIAILAAHTNLDRAGNGLNDWLAARLDLNDCQPLATASGSLNKLVVCVPPDHAESVAEALFAGGAGTVGRYDRCSFRASGIGTFRPGAGTRPFTGSVGSNSEVAEVRLETIVPAEAVSRVINRMLKTHPYEEVAYDLIPLANRRSDVGLGRIGRLPQPLPLEHFARRVGERLATATLRYCGDPQQLVSKVAVCGGSGMSLLAEAARQGADALVTGDVKYHEARSAEARGVALVDAGHFATERLAVPVLVAVLQQEAVRRGLLLEFIEMSAERDPFRVLADADDGNGSGGQATGDAAGKQTGGRRAGRS
ncbi:MAG: Nif3-like dinuclear metal center hexameric protein [Desulfuromonadales bacterium GWD2_61_12]|nr:MAG: Nif3-like dinuclear metal center hexameric protein [Desulfuromonadales bacterium GWC2_61_20]OGR35850.1 MAG: Nif3-like dinuclear metal center hexameric protein [Desulfuromonadales bacterium GWD2_61_12]HBT82580.1 Nif3-like dinuclear metal center hexameric protein [Desulfuromonas sp.]